MKKLFFSLTATLLIIFNTGYSQDAQKSILIFIDKSSSVTALNDSDNISIQLSRIIEKEITEDQNRVIISFIYAHTANAKNRKAFIYEPPKLLETPSSNRLKRKQTEIANLKRKKAYRSKWFKEIMKYVEQNQIERTETDLHGSLEVIADLLSVDQAPNKVFYLSDMVACFGDYKYFCKGGKVINNNKTLKSFVLDDISKMLADEKIRHTNFEEIKAIHIHLLQSPLSDKLSSVYATRYWRTLYNELGVQTVHIY